MRLVRRSFVLTRSIRAALDGRGERLDWIAPVLALYLLQLTDEVEPPPLPALPEAPLSTC